MAKLFIKTNFQFDGKIYRTNEEGDVILTVSNNRLVKEREKEKHPKTKKWLSPVLNHCRPADEVAKRIFAGESVIVEQKTDEELQEEAQEAAEEEEKNKLRAEFDKIGKAYDRRWSVKTLKGQLTKARKEAGA